VIVYAIVDTRSSLDHPLDDAVETFVRRADAERFIEEVRRDDPELASSLRIEERELEAGGAELTPSGALRLLIARPAPVLRIAQPRLRRKVVGHQLAHLRA
jgi:hypothetical protein